MTITASFWSLCNLFGQLKEKLPLTRTQRAALDSSLNARFIGKLQLLLLLPQQSINFPLLNVFEYILVVPFFALILLSSFQG
ncbi:unnamed protein product [Lactuca virosa]|uniref:Uncharacterized protein n=1 Tax=Lactuca virosa TaxID=75947 RepID=A0AAU9PQT4_9ASTR|nr:unnamed protein product [Lactuca virosa]